MIGNILRILKGETVFVKTGSPRKYNVGSVVLINVGSLEKAAFRVTAVVQDNNSDLFSVWGNLVTTDVEDKELPSEHL